MKLTDLSDIFDSNLVPGPINFNFLGKALMMIHVHPVCLTIYTCRDEEEIDISDIELVCIEYDDETTPSTTPESEQPT